jgi:hypothetical protein
MKDKMNDTEYKKFIETLKTPEKTEYLRKFLAAGETDKDIPDGAYLIDEGKVTAEDIKWGKKVLKNYQNKIKNAR